MSGFASLLFVSGATPERFAKALASGADLICIDLEDAVALADKQAARTSTIAALRAEPRLAVRINGVNGIEGLRDLVALAESGVTPAALLVPMIESAAQVAVVAGAMPGVSIIPLIETPAGLARAAEVGGAPGVGAMMFGGGDMSAELGVALAWAPLATARGLFLLGCAAAGVPAIDVPFIGLDDPEGLDLECRRALELGFVAKAAIHPAQVATVNSLFRPDAAAIAEAREAVRVFDEAGGAAVRFRGRMLEKPVMRRYRRLLEMTE